MCDGFELVNKIPEGVKDRPVGTTRKCQQTVRRQIIQLMSNDIVG
jgi:hypothetical protein